MRLLDLVAGALEATANGAQARIQLELVLVKAAAPEVDPSTTALLARIERLEAGAAACDFRPPGAAGARGRGARTSSAIRDRPGPGRLELWPALVAQVRERNALLAALLAEARPLAAGDRAELAFPAGAAFLKRKAEQEETGAWPPRCGAG